MDSGSKAGFRGEDAVRGLPLGVDGAEREASLLRLRVSREADFDCRSFGCVGAVDCRGLWWLRSSVRLTDSRFSALRIEPGER